MEAVTAVLLDREREPHSLRPMVVCSVGLHVVIVVLMLFGAGRFLGAAAPAPKVVMSVSLGGAPGPVNGGANPLGGRAVQRAVTETARRPEPARPPAAKTPEMTIPVPAARTRAKPPKETPVEQPVKAAPDEAKGRMPSTGPEEKFGSSFSDTGVSGLGLGLATGGAGTGGALSVGDFCCPDYLVTMARRIKENWNYRQGIAGTSVMRFTIQRDGRLTDIGVEQSAGYVLDLTAQRALQQLRQLPPLPSAYAHSTLTVYLRFDYQR